eukprot:2840473-Pyramimonas_sp.AAC.1
MHELNLALCCVTHKRYRTEREAFEVLVGVRVPRNHSSANALSQLVPAKMGRFIPCVKWPVLPKLSRKNNRRVALYYHRKARLETPGTLER